ncbi:MAG: CvpA family protein [bacterium]|nr:CvpA family protein [bacterium]
MNWVDLCIFLILFYFAYRGFAIGFVGSLLNLISSILAVLVAVRFYPQVGTFFVETMGANKFAGPVLGFFALLLISEFALSFVFSYLYRFVMKLFLWLKPLYWVDKITGIFPQLAMGIVLLTTAIIVMLRLPFNTDLKDAILDSYWGKNVVPQAAILEPQMRQLLGAIPQETLLYLIPKTPSSEESIKMNFPDSRNLELSDDPTSEQEMFVLVNTERQMMGLKVLIWDPTIVPVARAHSTDMFKRSFFSHINPDGKSPFDRMTESKVQYVVAGENLAYAPTVEIAHKGLMNSPGHRENILRPEFGRIGIGVIDSGIYGKMFTQNFGD